MLDDVKDRAAEMIEALPERSMIAVIPLCGTEYGRTRNAYRAKADALEAVARIETVDRRGTLTQAVDLALEAFSGSESDESARRIVVVTDNQAANWPRGDLGERFKNIPDMVVVDAAPKETQNAWVDSVAIADGVADTTTETSITARIKYLGRDKRPNVNVALSINGEIKETKKVDLEDGQTAETTFRYHFAPEERLPGSVNYIEASVALDPDQLPDDDVRHLVIPVAAEINVLFVDQYWSPDEKPCQDGIVEKNDESERNRLGPKEDPATGRFGETYLLRGMLAPRITRCDGPQLIKVKHITLDELTRDRLKEARLVVVAGLPSPGDAVDLLRDYVRQGGPLIIAAGGNFDPVAWNNAAWKEGVGILPAPLTSELHGKSIEQLVEQSNERTELLTINPDSLSHAYFQFPEMSPADQASFFTGGGGGGFKPIFTKTAQVALDKQILTDLRKREAARIAAEQNELLELDAQDKTLVGKEKQAALKGDDLALREKGRARRESLEPNWLSWSGALPRQRDPRLPVDKLVELGQPRVLATLSNGMPLFVERRIGEGTVVFFASGLLKEWNFFVDSGPFLVMDRIARGLIEATLPKRNLTQVEQFTLPLADNLARYSLQRPTRNAAGEPREEPLAIEALGPDEYGVIVRNVTQRGIYKIVARRNTPDGGGEPIATIPFAVNGPGTESQLTALRRSDFDKQIAESAAETGKHLLWIDRGAPVNLSGTTAWGRDLWWWFAVALLACLACEMVVCAWPAWNPGTPRGSPAILA
ncbi:MAG: hypothetical protein QM811_13615 [Pirellulales bacterium]